TGLNIASFTKPGYLLDLAFLDGARHQLYCAWGCFHSFWSAQGWNGRSPENIQRRVLKQHDGLGVRYAAVDDHGERLVDRQFQHLDVLALVGDATTAADLHRRFILGDKEVQLLRHRA